MDSETLREQNRRMVLKITGECLKEKGIQGTTVDIVAKRAKLTTRSIYRYFGNRNQMIFEFAEKFLDVYYGNIVSRIADTGNEEKCGMEKMVQFLKIHCELFQKQYKDLILLGELEIYFSKQEATDRLFEKHVEKVRKIRNICMDILEEGMRDGSICQYAEKEVLSEMLVNAYTGLMRRIALIYQKSEFKDVPDPVRQMEEYERVILSYLKSTKD